MACLCSVLNKAKVLALIYSSVYAVCITMAKGISEI